ncbi:hypothetical protein EDD15DRAFT_2312841 [Pisolithus albus]|nr:hypothetical protein EDD15DRAFT_2312841 [Pisolithus albus]
MPRCAALDHPLVLYLQATLAVDLYLALVLAAVAACTRVLVCALKIHQAAVIVGPTAAAPVPATTITAARRHLPHSLHPRTYQPSRETNQNWKSSPVS